MNRLVALCLAILLHILPLVFLLTPKVVDPPKRVVPINLPEIDKKTFGEISMVGQQAPCEFYVGIGLRHQSQGRVIELAPNSPAMRAGIQLGDIFLRMVPMFPELGEKVIVSMMRGEIPYEVEMKAEKICEIKS